MGARGTGEVSLRARVRARVGPARFPYALVGAGAGAREGSATFAQGQDADGEASAGERAGEQRRYDRCVAHYFSSSPDSDAKRTPIRVELADRDVDVVTAAGVFSPGHVDLGTRQLLRAATELPERGLFVDVGCGWGPIALDMALRRPQARVVAVDVNERALELTRENAQHLGATNLEAMTPEEAASLGDIDVIRSNPPIRIGKQALHELLAAWLPRLSVDGVAELVVSKNLGADSLAAWIGAELGLACEKLASRKGFRILRVTRGASSAG